MKETISKTCKTCDIEKPETEEFFAFRKDQNAFRPECKECRSIKNKIRYEKKLKENPNYLSEQYHKKKEIDNERCKKWRENNKELVKTLKKKYYEDNKEKVLQRRREYVQQNPDKVKIWFNENREYRNKYGIEYKKNRKETDEVYKALTNFRETLRVYFKKRGGTKNKTAEQILGCTWNEFKEHIEKQFTDQMNWSNHGKYGWHLDHIIPISSAKTIEDVYRLNHHSNIQPLWWIDNIKKGNKTIT